MTWRWGHGRTASVSALLLLTALACSSSDPIQPSNANITVTASTAPAYSDQYQWARLQIDQITVRPLDAAMDARLPIPFGLLQSPEQLDVRSTAPLSLGTTPLRAGTYRVESVRISALSLNLAGTAPVLPVACSGTELISARVEGSVQVTFASPPLIQVSLDGTSSLNVAVDGPGIVTMLLNQPYTCGVPPFPAPTSTQLAQFISVN